MVELVRRPRVADEPTRRGVSLRHPGQPGRADGRPSPSRQRQKPVGKGLGISAALGAWGLPGERVDGSNPNGEENEQLSAAP